MGDNDDPPQSPPRRSTIDGEGSPPPSPVAMPESSTSQPEMATVDLEAAPTTTAAPPTQPSPPPPRQPSPRRTDRQSMAIEAPPPENGSSPSLASPQAAPEMTVDQDAGDVYGGFRRRFKLKKSRSTEPWSTTRKPRLPAIKRRIASAWAHNYFWLFLVVLAVITSISAFVMDETAANLRKGLVNGVLRTGGSQKDYGVILYVFLRVCITLIAVELTKRIAPIAAGSGIPEVKAILAGFSIPGFLEPRTLVAKVLGVVLLLGAGLPIGKEGPFIHTAAILAELLMRVPFFARHTNELFRNQMLSAAAAVGVSAAFGAPIGGILFSIEATANYYATSHYWGAFLCATVGAFTSRELAFKSYGAFSPHFDTVSYKHWEVWIFLLLSALCGILGGFFVTLFTAFVGLRRRCAALKMKGLQAIPKIVLGTNLGFSALVALTSGLFACWIGDFALLGTREVMDDLFSEFPLREDANPKLHQRSRWDERAGGVGASLCLFIIFTFFFSTLCIGLPVSNGLVTPSFAIGAGIGRLVGEALRTLTTSVSGECPLSPAGGYAIVGAAAFSVSVTGKLSIGVVISELTGQLSYSIPVLFACVVGLGAGQLVEIDIYAMIARLKALPHWPAIHSAANFSKTVADVVECTKAYEEPCLALVDDHPPANVQDTLNSATHVVIPVVRNGVFVGVMRVADLASAMEGDFIESIDDAWPRCAPSATLSHLCFLFDLHHKDRVFVVSGGGRLVGHVDASEVGQALAAKMPAQETSNPMRDASAAYWRGRRAQLSVQGSGAV